MASPTILFLAIALQASAPDISQAPDSDKPPETEVILSDDLPKPFLTDDADIIAIDEDGVNRMTVKVGLGESPDTASKPYDFMIDTASQRTILSDEIAKELALEVEERINIIALSGPSVVQTVYLPKLDLGRKSYGGLVTPTFPKRYIGSDGVLGLDSLQGQRILFDFAARQISVQNSSTRFRSDGLREIVVTARRRSGQLIYTGATIDGIRVSVIIDTGGELSIGNLALLRRLRLGKSALQDIQLTDVTGRTTTAQYGVTKDLLLSRAKFGIMPIAFADILPFKALKLDKKPALFLGMNALRQFERMGIDFAQRKIYFLLPEGA